MPKGHLPLACLACLTLVITACSIGPKYKRPEVQVPSAYKESPPASFKESDGWKIAQPNDDVSRGQWWAVFGDPQLSALEEELGVALVRRSTRRFRVTDAGQCWYEHSVRVLHDIDNARADVGLAGPAEQSR